MRNKKIYGEKISMDFYLYSEENINGLLDGDNLSNEEAGFMIGYIQENKN